MLAAAGPPATEQQESPRADRFADRASLQAE